MQIIIKSYNLNRQIYQVSFIIELLSNTKYLCIQRLNVPVSWCLPWSLILVSSASHSTADDTVIKQWYLIQCLNLGILVNPVAKFSSFIDMLL